MPASGWRAVSSLPSELTVGARPQRIDFKGSARPTIGVEWEFALVDPTTRELSNEAAAVIAEIGESPHVHKELLRNTVEVVTGICENSAEAMDDLRATLAPARAKDLVVDAPFARIQREQLADQRKCDAGLGRHVEARALQRFVRVQIAFLIDAVLFLEVEQRAR